MLKFIESVGGTWEFIKGLGEIAIIIVSVIMCYYIIQDIRMNDGEHDYD